MEAVFLYGFDKVKTAGISSDNDKKTRQNKLFHLL